MIESLSHVTDIVNLSEYALGITKVFKHIGGDDNVGATAREIWGKIAKN